MPARSEAQRRLFAVAENNPGALHADHKDLANLPKATLHEFASTKGLPKKKKKHSAIGAMAQKSSTALPD